jgi:hypothetical protein
METAIDRGTYMPQVKLKTGETLEVPIDDLIEFFDKRGDEILEQQEEKGEHDTPPDPTAFPFNETATLSHSGQ